MQKMFRLSMKRSVKLKRPYADDGSRSKDVIVSIMNSSYPSALHLLLQFQEFFLQLLIAIISQNLLSALLSLHV